MIPGSCNFLNFRSPSRNPMKPQFSSPNSPLNTRIFSLSESYCSFQSELLAPNRPVRLLKFRGRFVTLSPPDELLTSCSTRRSLWRRVHRLWCPYDYIADSTPHTTPLVSSCYSRWISTQRVKEALRMTKGSSRVNHHLPVPMFAICKPTPPKSTKFKAHLRTTRWV